MTSLLESKNELKDIRVLVVDDNAVLRTILSDMLESYGCEVKEGSNGQEALTICQNHKFDVIITDLKMPIMGGLEFINQIPQKNQASIRILMSGEASIEDVIAGFKKNIDDFIIKPFPNIEIIKQILIRQIEKNRLQNELDFKKNIVHIYNEILQFVISSSDTDKLLDFIYSSLKKLLPLNRMELLLFDSHRENLSIKYLKSDQQTQSHLGEMTTLNKSGYAHFFNSQNIDSYWGGAIELLNHKGLFTDRPIQEGMKSFITFPMIVSGSVFGFISFFSKNNNMFQPDYKDILLGIIPKISVSFERAIYQGQLHEENTFLRLNLKNLSNELIYQQEALIFSLAELAEKRDKETGFHLIRMQTFTRLIASAYFSEKDFFDIGLGKMKTDDIIEIICKSAPLHDIGKVGIPDSILLKPGKLTPEEFEVIKKHTLIGAECLENAAKRVSSCDFLEISRDIANYHHEKWNGLGYPMGLLNSQIPIHARIIALSDTYDALRSERIYKKAWTRDQVKEYILFESGKHFDPSVVEIFKALEPKLDKIYQSFL